MNERAAEVAVQRAEQKFTVLRPKRLIEPQRDDRVLALILVGLRVDENVDRIPDRVHADKHQHRHHEHHQYGL